MVLMINTEIKNCAKQCASIKPFDAKAALNLPLGVVNPLQLGFKNKLFVSFVMCGSTFLQIIISIST